MSPATALAISYARGPLIGTFLGLALYGVTCMQAFFYFRTYYSHDGWRLKLMVTFLVFLETVHATMTIWVMDDMLITRYGDVSALESPTWTYASLYILGFLVDFYVYLYFTWRIWLFTTTTWIPIFMSVISVSRTGISIFCCIYSVLKSTWQDYLDAVKTLIILGNALFIVGDTFSACTMAYHLAKFKSWAPPTRPRPRIDVLLNRLLVFCVATGLLTSFVDVLALIFTLSQPQTLAFMSAILVQTRLYANSLLASLNIRNATSRAYDNSDAVELPALSLRFASPSDLSTISEEEVVRPRAIRASHVLLPSPDSDSWRACSSGGLTKSSAVESWQTTEASGRTVPQL